MRTLVNMRDVLTEYHKGLECPHCQRNLLLVQSTLDFRKGAIFILKKGMCDTHGCITETKMVRAVKMHGGDAQILPSTDDFELPPALQALADYERKGGKGDR